MRRGRRNARASTIAGLALSTLLLCAGVASAENFLEALFGGSRPQPAPAEQPAAALTYATPSATPSVSPTAAEAGGGNGHVASFCVRLCDGRYFPVQRHAGATPIQTCNSLCPAAKTQVFSGSAISHAHAANGARYADLDNAFVYREKIVAGCTCNGRDAFGLASVNIANDPTLRAGDLVATEAGLKKFSGPQAQQRKGGGSPVNLSAEARPHRRVANGVAAN
jgi:hypothetical protein